MGDPDLPPAFEESIRAGLASIAAAGPQPGDDHLDALETRPAPSAPRRHHRMLLAAAAVVLALVGIVAALVWSGRDDERVITSNQAHPCGPDAPGPAIALPARYRDEDRLLIPLSVDAGVDGPSGTPTVVPGKGTAELRYPGGEVIRFRTAPGSAKEAAPSPFPTTRAEAEAEQADLVRSVTSGMTATGAVTTVDAPMPIPRPFLESLARDAAELPETMASAVAAGEAFPELDQSFEVGGHRFDRVVKYTDGVTHVSTDLASAGDAGVRSSGRELGVMVGAAQPEGVIEFASTDGDYDWLVFVPAGLDVALRSANGDRCTGAIDDALTGGQYWLIRDGNGDLKVTMEAATKGKPTKVIVSRYVG